jgi:hypothetical protein
MWRLGVQCEGSIRDSIRLAAPVQMNQVGVALWPGDESWGSRYPTVWVDQPDGGYEKKNGDFGSAPNRSDI